MSADYCRILLRDFPRSSEDDLSLFCFEFGAQGVSEDLKYSQPDVRYHPDVIESPRFDVNVYFDAKPSEEFFLQLQSRFPGVKVSSFDEQSKDWLEEWKKGFKPFVFVEPIWIVPSWCERPVEAQHFITMDPGMAFGTGTHETTRLAAQLLVETLGAVSRPSVLDVGTGTGILAMVAYMLGAGPVVAIDNDPEARRVARENLADNKCSAIAVPDANVEDIREPYDIVIANIIDGVLLDLQGALSRVLKPGGKMILSGILFDREEEFFKKFLASSGLKLEKKIKDGEWVGALLG